jgi:hypothetical protein
VAPPLTPSILLCGGLVFYDFPFHSRKVYDIIKKKILEKITSRFDSDKSFAKTETKDRFMIHCPKKLVHILNFMQN